MIIYRNRHTHDRFAVQVRRRRSTNTEIDLIEFDVYNKVGKRIFFNLVRYEDTMGVDWIEVTDPNELKAYSLLLL